MCYQSYDEERASILETSGDDKGAKRYQSEGDEASRRLASLRDRIHDTRDKVMDIIYSVKHDKGQGNGCGIS